MGKDDAKFTNPVTGEKFVHIDLADGSSELLYGPKDTATEKKHGHADFDADRSVTYNRNPTN
jgi:hypothetical protein